MDSLWLLLPGIVSAVAGNRIQSKIVATENRNGYRDTTFTHLDFRVVDAGF